MQITKINENKKAYLDLLLLGDEQEDMIDRYLERGEMYVLDDGGVKTVCVVTDEGEGVFEIKNIATTPDAQGKGYGRAMIAFVVEACRPRAKTILVGTGAVEKTLGFYRSCGFTDSHIVKDFFTDNYDHEIIEDGVTLRDMIYLKIEIT